MNLVLRFAILLTLVVIATLLATPVAAGPAPAGQDLVALASRTAVLINQERLKHDLLPLRWNDTLSLAAAQYARELADRNFFAHNSPEGSTPVSRARSAGYPSYGWGGVYVGENLARGFSTPEGALQGWLASEGHRTNLLDPKYRETGVGVAVAASGSLVWAQEFGSRPSVLPVFINGDSPSTESPEVTVSMSAEDVSSWGSLGRVTSMMLSNRRDFADSGWEPFSKKRAWRLEAEPGLKTVYVRLRDERGTSVESSDQIVLGNPRVSTGVQPQLSTLTSTPSSSIPEFRLGFRTLAGLIPERVGEPLDNERSDGAGNSLQLTTRGLMVWVKSFNWTSFTDGFWTWIHGPFGLQQRLNGERFEWER